MLFRAVPVLVVVLATAVIFPLRRAHLDLSDRASSTTVATVTRPPARNSHGDHPLSLAHRHGQSGAGHVRHRIVETVTVTFQAEWPCGTAPTPTVSVAPQPVHDVPEPPPKHATL
jgi:hypothetical protein